MSQQSGELMGLRIAFGLLVLVLSACTGISTIVIGDAAEPIPAEQVKVFYSNLPDCEYDVIAIIQVPGEYYSRMSIIRAIKERASLLGADAIHVHHLSKRGVNIYQAQARALRCQRQDGQNVRELMI